jgi:hypothetical protein
MIKLNRLVKEALGKPGQVIPNPYVRAFAPIKEEQDHEVSMAQNSLDAIIKNATELKQKLGEVEKNVTGWIQDHITNSENYIEQANGGYHELGESVINEDANMNKKVKQLLDKKLKDLTKGRPNHQWAVMHILMGALGDANFHSEAKMVSKLFPKAKYEGDPMAEKDLEKYYHYDLGSDVANICKWDGKDIVMAIGFYVSMTIGRPVGEKVEKLVESINEAFNDNKNLNYIMKGRKVTNVAYDSDFGFAVILDNGKYVLFNTHSARPGQSKDMEFESVNEAVPTQTKWAVAIASLTATRADAVQKFIDDNNLNSEKLHSYIKKGKLSDRMDFVTALAGKPGNPIQKKMIKMFGESLNQTKITEALVSVDAKAVQAFFDKKPFEGKNLNSDGKVLKTVGIGSQEMYIHTPNGAKLVGKITGKYAQSLVQYVNKNYKYELA